MNEKTWFCVSAGSCVTSFIVAALPYLQFIAVVVTIAAGVKAFFAKGKQ